MLGFVTPAVQNKWPNKPWFRIWANSCDGSIASDTQCALFLKLNEILTTKDKLFRHNLTDSSRCEFCASNDTIRHRIINCKGAKYSWKCLLDALSKLTNKESEKWDDSDIIVLNIQIQDFDLFKLLLNITAAVIEYNIKNYPVDPNSFKDFYSNLITKLKKILDVEKFSHLI